MWTYIKRHKSAFGSLGSPVNSHKCAQWLRPSWSSYQRLLNRHIGDINKTLFNFGMIAVKQVLAKREGNIGVDRLDEVRQ
jgi:hypothetical protein